MTLIDCLHVCNPWWNGDGVEPGLLCPSIRSEFAQIVKELGGEKIVVGLTGPRGAGKTTLLFQTVHYLLQMKVPAERILFFGGDDLSLFIHNLHAQDVVMAYCTGVLREEPEQLTQPVYVVIDEAHRVRGWRLFVQRSREKGWQIHFVVAAPTPQLLFPPGSETLHEMARLLPVAPLCAPQFLEFYCAYRETEFDFASYKSRMPGIVPFDAPTHFARALRERVTDLEPFRAGKRKIFGQYLLAGGFPGFFSAPDMHTWHRRLLGELTDQILYGDLLSNYAIKSPEKLKKLLYYLAFLEGREQAYAGIGRYLSLNTVTVMHHLRLFAEDRIAVACDYYKDNLTGVMRKNKRFYLRDTGMKYALLHRSALSGEDGARACREAVLAMLFESAEKNGGRVWYWRGARGQVVYVLERREGLLPVQFLTGLEIGRQDPRALQAFCRAFDCAEGLAVTREALDVQDGIAYVPLWLL